MRALIVSGLLTCLTVVGAIVPTTTATAATNPGTQVASMAGVTARVVNGGDFIKITNTTNFKVVVKVKTKAVADNGWSIQTIVASYVVPRKHTSIWKIGGGPKWNYKITSMDGYSVRPLAALPRNAVTARVARGDWLTVINRSKYDVTSTIKTRAVSGVYEGHSETGTFRVRARHRDTWQLWLPGTSKVVSIKGTYKSPF